MTGEVVALVTATELVVPLASSEEPSREGPAEPSIELPEPGRIPAAASAAAEVENSEAEETARDPELWLYRYRTLALLRRYFRLSVEVGRLPSLLGRELFRVQITPYDIATFEDTVIFVHDVERSLEKLDEFERKVIGKVVFQDYTQDEAARLLGCWRRTVSRRFYEALDRLSEIFLESGLLTWLPGRNPGGGETCQEGKIGENPASDSEQRK